MPPGSSISLHHSVHPGRPACVGSWLGCRMAVLSTLLHTMIDWDVNRTASTVAPIPPHAIQPDVSSRCCIDTFHFRSGWYECRTIISPLIRVSPSFPPRRAGGGGVGGSVGCALWRVLVPRRVIITVIMGLTAALKGESDRRSLLSSFLHSLARRLQHPLHTSHSFLSPSSQSIQTGNKDS